MTRAARIVAAARATIGARFRPHGRDPALGLDCVGVAVWALAAAGAAAVLPEMLDGLVACDGAAAGDLLLCRAGGGLHLAIRTEAGVVHADAGLRRVVERPGAPPWSVLAAYRLEGE